MKTLEDLIDERINRIVKKLNLQFQCETNEPGYGYDTLSLNIGDERVSSVEVYTGDE